MNLIDGSCDCGKVKYTLHSEIKNIVNSHCKLCKEPEGPSTSTYAVLPIESMEITQGSELIQMYKICSEKRHFCSSCGTPVYETNRKLADVAMVTLRTLNPTFQINPNANIWCECSV